MPAPRQQAEVILSATSPRSSCLQMAFFDVDGTCVDTTILHYYFWFVRDRVAPPWRWLRIGKLLSLVPYYWVLDQVSRTAFNIAFYRAYAGIAAAELEDWGRTALRQRLLPHVYPGARAELRALGRRRVPITFVTGSLPAVVEPVRQLAAQEGSPAEVLGSVLAVRRGVFTGELEGEPLASEAKRRRLEALARERGINLEQCAAYGDSMADLPMLEAVGQPVAANPSPSLRRLAQRRGWTICDWA